VPHIDEAGRAVRVKQWIVELEAPVDVSALLREEENMESMLAQADFSASVLVGETGQGAQEALAMRPGFPTVEQIANRLGSMGINTEGFNRYADGRWGSGWKFNPQGRGRVWDEIERYRNDPEGYADKIGAACGAMV
jgi:hypothetical protein